MQVFFSQFELLLKFFLFFLCASVSLWLFDFEHRSPQRHRGASERKSPYISRSNFTAYFSNARDGDVPVTRSAPDLRQYTFEIAAENAFDF
jgi:hypothetical protein